MIHDQYKRLFLQQSRICELTKELRDSKDKKNQENKRKLMFYQPISLKSIFGSNWIRYGTDGSSVGIRCNS